jgi:hypothetical protein
MHGDPDQRQHLQHENATGAGLPNNPVLCNNEHQMTSAAPTARRYHIRHGRSTPSEAAREAPTHLCPTAEAGAAAGAGRAGRDNEGWTRERDKAGAGRIKEGRAPLPGCAPSKDAPWGGGIRGVRVDKMLRNEAAAVDSESTHSTFRMWLTSSAQGVRHGTATTPIRPDCGPAHGPGTGVSAHGGDCDTAGARARGQRPEAC